MKALFYISCTQNKKTDTYRLTFNIKGHQSDKACNLQEKVDKDCDTRIQRKHFDSRHVRQGTCKIKRSHI